MGLIQTTMPPDRPAGLPEATYVNIIAYMLQFNGSAPGTQPLTATTAVSDRRERARRRPRAAGRPARRLEDDGVAERARMRGAAGAAGRRARSAAGGRGQQAPAPTGVTVAGEVKNFARSPTRCCAIRRPATGRCCGAISTRRATAR